jgi:hypothetical protein
VFDDEFEEHTEQFRTFHSKDKASGLQVTIVVGQVASSPDPAVVQPASAEEALDDQRHQAHR